MVELNRAINVTPDMEARSVERPKSVNSDHSRATRLTFTSGRNQRDAKSSLSQVTNARPLTAAGRKAKQRRGIKNEKYKIMR